MCCVDRVTHIMNKIVMTFLVMGLYLLHVSRIIRARPEAFVGLRDSVSEVVVVGSYESTYLTKPSPFLDASMNVKSRTSTGQERFSGDTTEGGRSSCRPGLGG